MRSHGMGCADAAPELMFTGERVVPGKTPPFLVLEHLVRYRFAARYSLGSKILDVGCGTGYGAAILAETASLAVGVDSDRETIHYADKVHPRPNLRFTLADCRNLPFADGLFGLAVSFEVIEHIREQDQYLGEIRRVLSPNGMLILSTPNALRSTKMIEEANPFHHKELTEAEFKELLGRHFDHVQLLYQHEFSASGIQPTEPEKIESVEIVEDFASLQPAKYFIAVCGARPATVSRRRSLGVGGIEHQIAIIQDVRQAQKEVAALIRQREQNAHEYSENLSAHRQAIDALRKEIDALLHQREQNAREYSENLAAHRQAIESSRNEIEGLLHQREVQKIELEWLYRWIPMNKLARKLLFGRSLRSRLRSRLHPP